MPASLYDLSLTPVINHIGRVVAFHPAPYIYCTLHSSAVFAATHKSGLGAGKSALAASWHW